MNSSDPSVTIRQRFQTVSGPPPPPPLNQRDLVTGPGNMDLRRVPLRAILRRRGIEVLLVVLILWLLMSKLTGDGVLPIRSCMTTEFGFNPSQTLHPAFLPPENTTYRYSDTIDTFQNYAWRNHSACQISSLDLHAAFSPLCQTREDFLQAFSNGGRVGFNQPFMPRGCDMRWFTTEEVCEILGRFEKVAVVGDSMMRHVVGALNVLLRKDLGYGAVTNWNFDEQELRDCFCNHQMDVKSCSLQGVYTTSSVLINDPASFACPTSGPPSPDLVIEMMLRFPLDPEEVQRYKDLLSTRKPKKPYAFIFGHGLWNDLDIQASLHWLDGILEHTIAKAPYLSLPPSAHTRNPPNSPPSRHDSTSLFPRLFIPPNAAGILKPDEWLVSQGDKALMTFEESMRVESARRGVDTLGTWNMSVQARKYDGAHLDLKGNLIKAMGVVNWLSLVDTDEW